MASGIIHKGTMTGKLKGVMPATTPSGSCVIVQLIPGPTSDDSPFNTFGKLVAYSITSTPRSILPLASAIVLPLSRAINAARLSISFSMIDLNLNIICTLSRILVSAQLGNADFAFSTAISRSLFPESGIVAICLSKYGEITLILFPELLSSHLLPTQLP